MGNTWATYYAFRADPFRDEFWSFPKQVPEERWKEIVTGAWCFRERTQCAGFDRGRLQKERDRFLQYYMPGPGKGEPDRIAPPEQGLRAIRTMEAGEVLLDYCAGACDAGYLKGWDLCSQMNGGDLEISGDPLWDRFARALGFPGPSGDLPWWVATAYPSDHYVGLTDPAGLLELYRDLRNGNVFNRVGARLRPESSTAKTLKELAAFMDSVAYGGRWLLAVESH